MLYQLSYASPNSDALHLIRRAGERHGSAPAGMRRRCNFSTWVRVGPSRRGRSGGSGNRVMRAGIQAPRMYWHIPCIAMHGICQIRGGKSRSVHRTHQLINEQALVLVLSLLVREWMEEQRAVDRQAEEHAGRYPRSTSQRWSAGWHTTYRHPV